ncbi:MAG: FKBP-type peptidyl-prolyl cis-trans isomerase [Dehalococcoidia bacterium]
MTRLRPRQLRLASFALAPLLAFAVACSGGAGIDGGASAAPTVTTTATAQQAQARVARDGDKVEVHYRGTLDNGEEFDSSAGRDPLGFTVGAGQMIAGFDAAVRGMAVGETVTVHIEAAEAYGERRDDLIIEFPIDQAPADVAVGDRLQLSNGAPATVVAVTETTVTIDANHELAGETLTFTIELVSLQ